jgi:hypothetical protein
MSALVLAMVLTVMPADTVPAPLRGPLGVKAKSDDRLWVENVGEVDCQGRRCSTDFALAMELKERPAGTPEQRLRSELAQKAHPGGPGRIIGPVHHVGRLWTARWTVASSVSWRLASATCGSGSSRLSVRREWTGTGRTPSLGSRSELGRPLRGGLSGWLDAGRLQKSCRRPASQAPGSPSSVRPPPSPR